VARKNQTPKQLTAVVVFPFSALESIQL